MSHSSKTRPRQGAAFFIACCAAYVVSAAYLNIYGPDAPLIMNHYGLDAGGQGLLMTLQSLGGSVAAIYIGLHGERFNKIHAVTAGCLVLGLGCVLMSLAPPYAVLGCIAAIAGFGFTIVDINVNGVIADVYTDRKETLISIGHAFYGVGAMLAPSMVAFIVSERAPSTFTIPFLLIGVLSLVVFAFAAFSGRPLVQLSPYKDMRTMRARVRNGAGEVFRTRFAWMLLLAGFLYFTFQMGVASWLPSWGIEAGMSFEAASFLTSGFFAGQLAMGFASALILRKVKAGDLFGISGLAGAGLMAAALFAGASAVTPVLVAASGFFQGSGVITLIVVLTDAFPERTASASSIQVISANTAAVTAPLWIGNMADSVGYGVPLLISCGFFAIGCIVMLVQTAKRNRRAA